MTIFAEAYLIFSLTSILILGSRQHEKQFSSYVQFDNVFWNTCTSLLLKETLKQCRSTLYQFGFWNMYSYFLFIAALHLLNDGKFLQHERLIWICLFSLVWRLFFIQFSPYRDAKICLWTLESSFGVLWRFFPILSIFFYTVHMLISFCIRSLHNLFWIETTSPLSGATYGCIRICFLQIKC